MAPRKRRKKTVALITLPVGTTFVLPHCGRTGRLLSPPTDFGAYVRLWRLPDEVDVPKYTDAHITSNVEVLVTSLPVELAAEAEESSDL